MNAEVMTTAAPDSTARFSCGSVGVKLIAIHPTKGALIIGNYLRLSYSVDLVARKPKRLLSLSVLAYFRVECLKLLTLALQARGIDIDHLPTRFGPGYGIPAQITPGSPRQ